MKQLNIFLSCILVMGLAASCGSSKKATTSQQSRCRVLFPYLMVKQLPDGADTTNLHSLHQAGMLLMVLFTASVQAPVKQAVVATLSTTRSSANFELDLEWKISEGGNSGIFILAQEIPNEPIYKSAPEMQILDNERHPDAKLGVDGNRMAGSLYDLIPAKPQNSKPAGQWNHVHILVYQGTVVFSQNGANVVEFHLWTDDWKKMVSNSKFKDWGMVPEYSERRLYWSSGSWK